MALQQKLEVRLKVILLNYFWIISYTQPEETGGFRASTFGRRQQATSISTWKSHSFLLLSLEDNLIKSSFSDQHTLVLVSPVLSFPFLSVDFCQKRSSPHIHSLGCLPSYHLTPSWSYLPSPLSFSIYLLVMSESPLPNPTLFSYLQVRNKGSSGLILSRPTCKESTLSHFMALLNSSSSPTSCNASRWLVHESPLVLFS